MLYLTINIFYIFCFCKFIYFFVKKYFFYKTIIKKNLNTNKRINKKINKFGFLYLKKISEFVVNFFLGVESYILSIFFFIKKPA